MLRICFLVVSFIVSASLFAADPRFSGLTYEGFIHNNEVQHFATLSAHGKVYRLDFRGADLYHVAERYDRERVIVRGSVAFPHYESLPVIHVDSITFRPFGRAVTYDTHSPRRFIQRRAYVQRRPYVKERTVIREYDYDAR